MNIRKYIIVSITLLVLFTLILLNLALGSIHIPFKEVINIIIGNSSENIIWENILIRTRLPQTMAALGAGMALGVAGLLMQTLFRNPLAGPSVLGISSGSSLGVAFIMLVAGRFVDISIINFGLWGDLAIIACSLIGAFGVLLIILFVSHRIGGTLGVLIIGVMVGYLANSIISVMKFYSAEEEIFSYVIWGLGSFSRLTLERSIFFLAITAIPSIATLLLSKSLNLMSLGDNYARNLGLRIKRARILIILSAGALTATVTAFCGPIIFIGMAVPHMAKLMSKTSNHFQLITNSCILGAITALLCNLIARLPGLESELPINSVTAFIGAPVVISVIFKRRRENIMER